MTSVASERSITYARTPPEWTQSRMRNTKSMWLVENLVELHEKLKSKTYRAQPLRRIYIDKEDGRKRPISIPSVEDKIVQRATVELLNAIFDHDFLDCSYGFRPGRSAHDALDPVGRVICRGSTE